MCFTYLHVLTYTCLMKFYNAKDQGGESKSHPLRGEGENMPVNNGGTNI